MAELYLGKPLLPGKNKEDQLVRIFGLFGLPNKNNWPEMSREFPEFSPFSYRVSSPPADLRKVLGGEGDRLCADGFDLIMQMIQYSPKNRISAADAMRHRFFNDILTSEIGKNRTQQQIE